MFLISRFPCCERLPQQILLSLLCFCWFFVPQMRKVTNSLECSFLGECLPGLVYHRSGMLCSYIWHSRVAGKLTASIWRQWGLRKCRPHDSRLIQRNDLPGVMCWSDSTLCREWPVVPSPLVIKCETQRSGVAWSCLNNMYLTDFFFFKYLGKGW